MARDYTYIVARMRGIEATRPDAAWFQRIARASSGSLLGSVKEFFPGFEQVESIHRFEAGIEYGKSEILDLVESLLPDNDTIEFFRAEYDFDNMVDLWKSRILGKSASMSSFGLVDPEKIEQALSGSTVTWLPEYLKELYERLGYAQASGDIRAVDGEGERAKWRFLLERAPSEEARRFVVNRIDLGNIKSFIRLKRTGIRRSNISAFWIEGGEIDPSTLDSLFKEPEDEFYTYLTVTGYRGLVQRGLNRNTPLWKAETLISSQLIGMISESAYRFFDIMPVIYHLQLRDREALLLRIIFTGKINGLPEEMILEKVAEVLS